MLNSNPVDVAGLPSLDEESGTESRQVLSNDAAPVLDAFLQSCDAERFGIWSFRTLVRGIEWDPALFTRVLDECASKFESTFEHASILTYACGNRATPVPHGYVPVEGCLKMKGTDTVMRSTLKRRLQHPDLQNPDNPEISWKIQWVPCRVGRTCRYTDHVLIQTFHRETALPLTGVLQRSADAVGPRLRVDFLGPSDAPLNRGGWAARKERQAAADAGAAGAGAPAGAPPAAPAPSPTPADMPPASAPDAARATARPAAGAGASQPARTDAAAGAARPPRPAARPPAAAARPPAAAPATPAASRLAAFGALIRARLGEFEKMRDNIIQTKALVRMVWRNSISWLFSPHIWTAIASSDQGLADSRLFPGLYG